MRAFYIGGCAAPYHRLEPTIEPITSALAGIGVTTDAGGMYHPDGGDAATGDYSALNAANLANYDALVLFTTGPDSGHDAEADAVVDFVQRGGALVGIHCAADSYRSHAAYTALVGGRFRSHPAPLDIALEYVDTQHPITRGLSPFTVNDELYLFRDYDPARVHLLAQTHSFADDAHPTGIPLCWTRTEGQGRVFYLSLGHFPHVLHDPNWRALFQRGTQWATRAI